jgi:hypothetical protein
MKKLLLLALSVSSVFAANPSFNDLTNGAVSRLVVTNTTANPVENLFGNPDDTNRFPGQIHTTNQLNGWLNVRSKGVLGGTNNDFSTVQAAVWSAQSGSVLYFPPHPTGKYTFSSIVVTQSNITLDGGGNYIDSATNGVGVFLLMPHSLYISNRLTGGDFPVTWRNAGVPCPVDADYETMMYENNVSLRLTNITIRNFRSIRDGNLIRAYSVDGLSIEGNTVNAPNNGAARMFHCTGINMHDNNFTGGNTSYLVFGFKCKEASIFNNILSSTGTRTVSFKGGYHAAGYSIFEPSTNWVDGKIDIHDNLVSYAWDSMVVDWPPDSNLDVGSDCGITTGITKADWYGRLDGVKVHNNTFSYSGSYSDGKGRYFWGGYPHRNITVENNTAFNGGVFMAGIDGAKISGNFTKNTQTGPNLIFIQEDTTTTNICQNITIRDNIHRNVYPAGTGGGSDPQPYYLDGQRFVVLDNKFEIGYTNIPNVVVIGPTFDRSFVIGNRGWANSTNVILPNMVLTTFGGTNNLHGITSDNTCFDMATDAVKTTGMVMWDNGAGSGLQIRMKNGFAGIGFMATNGVDYLSQIWSQVDTNVTNFVFYHNSAPRMTIRADGSSEYYSYLNLSETIDPADLPATNHANIYLKETGSGATRAYLQNNVGTVTEFGDNVVSLVVAASDESTALTTGTAKITFRMPYGVTLTSVRASLTTAQASGSTFTVDVRENGSSILSTLVTIDNTEKTSTTAATAPVLSDTSLANDSEVRVDITQVGDGTATGLKVYLIGTR